MCKYNILQIFLTYAIYTSNCQNNEEISFESGEMSNINNVVGSASKEDYGKLDKIAKKGDLKRTTENDVSLEYQNSTTNAPENTTTTPEKNNSESDENVCRSTQVSYPFAASVQKKGSHYASGALIHRQHVITAAEEFYNVRENIKLFRVRLGSVDCKKGGILLPIKQVKIHPNFLPKKPSFDISVLRLAHPVQMSEYIQPIQFSRVQKGIVISAKFLTTYWPRLIVNGEVLPELAKERLKHHSMRVSTQRLIPWKTCATLIKAREAVLDETSLCLKPIATHHSPCMPDVGAPVIADDGLWGITSGWTNEHCAKYPSPTVFTRATLEPVRSWLKEVVERNG